MMVDKTSNITIDPLAITTKTSCQNLDRMDNSNNITERRKEVLLTAMQEYPELFWKTKENQNDPNSAMDTNPVDSNIILESTDENNPQDDETDVTTTTASPKTRLWVDMDTTLWTSIQELLKEKVTTGTSDDVDINDTIPSALSSTYRLRRIRSYLDRVLQELVDNDRMEAGDDSCTDKDDMAIATKDVASKLVQHTTNDLLHIIQSMIDETARTSDDHKSEINDIGLNGNVTTGNVTKVVDDKFPTIEEWVLLCSEDFPQEKRGTSKNDDHHNDNNSIDYFENLESRSATFANAGNSNDPLVHNLICHEKGFFEGDDAAVVLDEGDDDTTNDAERNFQQLLLLLLQETTRMIRTKTLDLTRQRIKRKKKM
jgi:two-component sensor histidine kinase